MKVPEDIILLWADDNSGNLLRTPYSNQTDRAGAGVYYHFDYVGIPRNYKWINTIQLIKTWEQMQLAYEKGARSLWIANVGDIKRLVCKLHILLSLQVPLVRLLILLIGNTNESLSRHGI